MERIQDWDKSNSSVPKLEPGFFSALYSNRIHHDVNGRFAWLRQTDWSMHGNEQPTLPIFKGVFSLQRQLRRQVYHLTHIKRKVLWTIL